MGKLFPNYLKQLLFIAQHFFIFYLLKSTSLSKCWPEFYVLPLSLFARNVSSKQEVTYL